MVRKIATKAVTNGYALEVGYTSPSHFAQMFGRVVGVTPTEFRSSL